MRRALGSKLIWMRVTTSLPVEDDPVPLGLGARAGRLGASALRSLQQRVEEALFEAGAEPGVAFGGAIGAAKPDVDVGHLSCTPEDRSLRPLPFTPAPWFCRAKRGM
jgi:hypothetical protein